MIGELLKKTDRMQEIEEEYGHPIREIISDFRQDLTWEDVATCLEISRETLLVWRRRLEMPIDGRSRVRYSLESTPIDKSAQKLGYKDAEDAIFQLVFKQGRSREEVCSILRCHVSTLHRHYPKGREYFRKF